MGQVIQHGGKFAAREQFRWVQVPGGKGWHGDLQVWLIAADRKNAAWSLIRASGGQEGKKQRVSFNN